MLAILCGDMEGNICNTSKDFNNTYPLVWFENSSAQRIIKPVDKGVALGPNAIETRVLGVVPPEKISAGTKTLPLMYFLPNKVFNARNRGDNCGHWILCIGAKKNPIINLHHMMDFGNGKFTINNDNAGQIVHSMDELVRVAGDCLQEMYQWGRPPGCYSQQKRELPFISKAASTARVQNLHAASYLMISNALLSSSIERSSRF